MVSLLSLSHNFFSKGYLSVSPSQRSVCRSVVCEAAPTKRLDYVEKRARQVEKRRIYNKSKKSEIKTRLKKLEQKKKYAAWKAADIRKAVKEGRKPQAGPPAACLPTLATIPIWIGLYQALLNVANEIKEAEFLKGLNMLTSLRHENLVKLRGFCCSSGCGECFLIYEFIPNGSLLRYLDVKEGDSNVLEWSITRVSIVKGNA